MKPILPLAFAVLALAASVVQARPANLAVSADKTTPLTVGAKAPGPTLKTPDGQAFDLGTAYAAKPTVVILYRGGWCGYCNKQLAALAELEPKLLALGYQIIAISPDRPAALQPTIDKHHLNYRLLSDQEMKAIPAFGVAFQVDAATVEKYAKRNMELPPAPGDPSIRWLPAPSVFIVGTDRTIRFVYSNPDYSVRLSSDQLLAAAEAAVSKR